MSTKWEVADVLRQVNTDNYTIHQQKTLRAISLCRTAALGGHVDACDECGMVHISYNSCRNRHCPKCQSHKRDEWIQSREADLLPCTYYHLVFTLPQELNTLALYQPKLAYDALFKSVWSTLRQFGTNEGLTLGMISILHTWGQNLSLHPHLHCIVPGGGIDNKGKWHRKIRSAKFLFPVKALSKVFRAKYVRLLREKGICDKMFIESLFSKGWVVYAKRPFGGPKQVIGYLGRYTHKVAISNHRIETVDNNQVIFKYKDYKDGGKSKLMTLSNVEFIRRFTLHILPQRFVRIRHYGILSSSWKRGKLQQLQQVLNVKKYSATPIINHRRCPYCKTGTLITIDVFGSRGPPAMYLSASPQTPMV